MGEPLKEWKLDTSTWTLQHFDEQGQNDYEVDLEACKNSAAVLDWIMQVASKGWASNRTIGELVRAIDWLLYPQGSMCAGALSGGTSGKSIEPRKLLPKRVESAKREGLLVL